MASEMFSETYIGTVLKINKENRKIGVYIPKLMPGIDGGSEIRYKVPTNAGLELPNISKNISRIVEKNNFIWVSALDYNEPLPKVGSKVFIDFIDNNPNLVYWSKFNMNNDYEVIDEEKYSKVNDLQIGNKIFQIDSEDKIQIDLPDYFDVNEIPSDDKKHKHFKITENYKFYLNLPLEESISKLQKSISFLESEYESTFRKRIDKVNIQYDHLNDTLDKQLEEYFSNYKKDSYKLIKESEDLSDSNNYFNYYYSLLTGLNDTYKNYQQYLEKYNAFDKKDIIPNITIDTINNKILNIFEISGERSNFENIENYVEYITNVFYPKISLIFNYNDINDIPQKFEIINNVFELLPNSDPRLANLKPIPSLALTNNLMKSVQSSYKFYSFDDSDNNNIFINTGTNELPVLENKFNYYTISDKNVFAKFYGIYLYLDEENKLQIDNFNNTTLNIKDPINISINVTGETSPFTFSNISEANMKLSEYSAENIESINITMSLEDLIHTGNTIPDLELKYQKIEKNKI